MWTLKYFSCRNSIFSLLIDIQEPDAGALPVPVIFNKIPTTGAAGYRYKSLVWLGQFFRTYPLAIFSAHIYHSLSWPIICIRLNDERNFEPLYVYSTVCVIVFSGICVRLTVKVENVGFRHSILKNKKIKKKRRTVGNLPFLSMISSLSRTMMIWGYFVELFVL